MPFVLKFLTFDRIGICLKGSVGIKLPNYFKWKFTGNNSKKNARVN